MGQYRLALLVFFITAGFYTYTLQPSLTWGDGVRLQQEAVKGESYVLAEMVAGDFVPDPLPFAKVGVAAWDHPLYIVFSHTLLSVFPGASPLWLVNMVSAIFGAGTIALLFLWVLDHTRSYSAALIACVSLAVSHTFWWHSATPEVYTLFSFFLLLALVAYDRFERTSNFAPLAISLFAIGLAASTHLLAFLAVPGMIIFYWLNRKSNSIAFRPASLIFAGLAFLAGFSLYLFQLARMVRAFPVSEVLGPLAGATFMRISLLSAPAVYLQSSLGYLFYLAIQFSPLFLLLGIYGLVNGSQISLLSWRKIIAFYFVYTGFGILYHVPDQFAFLLTSHIFFAAAAGLGLAVLANKLDLTQRNLLYAACALLVLAMPLFYQALPQLARAGGLSDAALGIPAVGTGVRDGLSFYINPNKRGDYSALEFGRRTLMALPDDSMVIAHWYPDTDEYFILRYFLQVEHMRPDVQLLTWPTTDLDEFNPALVRATIQTEIADHPIFLASLDEAFYGISSLMEDYCVATEYNLYRLYPRRTSPSTSSCNFLSGGISP